MKTEIVIPDCPPSLNKAQGKAWQKWRWWKQKWQNDIMLSIFVKRGKVEMATPVIITARLRFPVKRRRDEDNFKALLTKATQDALVNGGYIPDDTPNYVQFQALIFEELRGPKQTTLIFEEPGEPEADEQAPSPRVRWEASI